MSNPTRSKWGRWWWVWPASMLVWAYGFGTMLATQIAKAEGVCP